MADDPSSLDSAAFAGTLRKVRQLGEDVIFEIAAPAEKATEYLERIGGFPKPGESRWLAIAQLRQQPETESQREPSPHETSTRQTFERTEPARLVHNPYSRRAGILSADPLFWRFIEAVGEDKATFAASYVRHFCKVTSRKDILPGSEAALRFDLLESDFIGWRDGPKHGVDDGGSAERNKRHASEVCRTTS